MAYDGYRSPPPAEQPAFFEYSDPRVHYPGGYPHHYASDIPRARPGDHSSARTDDFAPDATRPSQSQHQINEAVSSAFHKAEPSSYAPPELVAQITENVIKHLKTTGLEGGTPIPQQQQQPAPPPPAAQSPPSNRSGTSPVMTNRSAYGPPSPRLKPEHPMYGSPPQSSASNPNPHSLRESQFVHETERKSSSPSTQTSDHDHRRPKGPVRLSTSKQETTLEKIWGQLFDEAGHPTVRIGQFLRGLAIHLVGSTIQLCLVRALFFLVGANQDMQIEDYEPRHSIVVTPSKMLKYYQDVKLPSEPYPWNRRLSMLTYDRILHTNLRSHLRPRYLKHIETVPSARMPTSPSARTQRREARNPWFDTRWIRALGHTFDTGKP